MPAARLRRSLSAARTFATKHGYTLNPRQEFSWRRRGKSGDGARAWLPRGRRPVAIIRERQGGRADPSRARFRVGDAGALPAVPYGAVENLPKAVLAAVVLTAMFGLLDFPALLRMWRVSPLDLYAAAVALAAVLFFGILQGILTAALASVLMLLARASRPHVAFLGRIPGTSTYSDLARHPENEMLAGVIAFRPEASLIYVNADAILKSLLTRLGTAGPPTFTWWSAISRHRPISTSQARTCCTNFTVNLPLVALNCG